jgi:hypothetical protein
MAQSLGIVRSAVPAAALLALIGGLAACAPSVKMKKFNITTGPDASLKEASSSKMGKLEVDLVAVGGNQDDLNKWRTKNLNDYFSGNDPLRAGAKDYTRSLTFSDGNEARITITKGDEIWKTWYPNRSNLFVLANSRALAMESQKQEGRRREIPLTSDYWKGDSFTIIIKNSGIEVDPPPTKAESN